MDGQQLPERKSLKLAQLPTFVPRVLDGVDRDERRLVLALVPPALQLLAQRRWEPRYGKREATRWG